MNLSEMLLSSQTVAVVGVSDKPERPSYQVAKYLYDHGFTILPVNPNIPSFLGIPAYGSLDSIPDDIHIDIVDIFRKSQDVLSIVEEVIRSGRAPIIWMQEGVVSLEAQELAQAHSLQVVMDRCMMKEHKKLSQPK